MADLVSELSAAISFSVTTDSDMDAEADDDGRFEEVIGTRQANVR